MILVVYAHLYPQHSCANKRMFEQIGALEGVGTCSFHQLYPDFNIDAAVEQAALVRAGLVIWQHPMQWYSVPPLLKLRMDKVLTHGWIYDHNGIALRGKSLMWAVATGGGESRFDIGSLPGLPVLAQSLQITVFYYGMKQLSPLAMHCTFIRDDETLQAQARRYRQRPTSWQGTHQNGQPHADTSADLPGRRGTNCTHRRPSRAGIGTRLSDRWLYYRPVGAATGG